jgi:hypothetical protein
MSKTAEQLAPILTLHKMPGGVYVMRIFDDRNAAIGAKVTQALTDAQGFILVGEKETRVFSVSGAPGGIPVRAPGASPARRLVNETGAALPAGEGPEMSDEQLARMQAEMHDVQPARPQVEPPDPMEAAMALADKATPTERGEEPTLSPEPQTEESTPTARRTRKKADPAPPNATCSRCQGSGQTQQGGTCPVCKGEGAIRRYGRRG